MRPTSIMRVASLVSFAFTWTIVTVADEASPKSAVPPAARQAELRKVVDETFEVSKANTLAKKQQAASKLMDMIADSATRSDELYVALQMALSLLRDTNDFPTYLTALEKLTDSFQLDAAAEKTTHLTEYMASCKSSTTLEPAVAEVVSMAEGAAQQNQFRVAHELIATAEKHAKRVTATKLTKSLGEVRSVVRGREQAFASMTAGQQTLMDKPDDAKSNLALGQWYAVYESKWEQALPRLKLGSDAKWKKAAESDIQASADVESQLAAADAWWDVSQTATVAAKVATQRRALDWYERAVPILKTPLAKARVTKRIEELNTALEAAGRLASDSTGAVEASTAAGEAGLEIDKWIDLLGMIELSEHALKGPWKKEAGKIIAPTSDAMLMFPVALNGSYELNCELTPAVDNAIVRFEFPTGTSSCSIIFNAENSGISGVELIDGKGVKDLIAAGTAATRAARLSVDKQNQILISVVQAGDRISIEARLDGKRIIHWSGQGSQLSQPCPYLARMIPLPQAVGMNVQGGASIHKCEVRLKRGARGFRLTDDWKNPATQVAPVPPKSVVAKCVTWNGRRYLFSDQPMNLPDAQRLAVQVQGRVLTISSPEEETFVLEAAGDHGIWLSGWRRPGRKEWLDERNRPLKYFGKWSPNEPGLNDTEPNLFIGGKKRDPSGWNDINPDNRYRAVIEWGEEYPETK